MGKRILLPLILLCGILSLGNLLQAQEQDRKLLKKEQRSKKKAERLERKLSNDRYLRTTYGLGFNQTQDTRMEQAVFRGPGATMQIAFQSYTSKGMEDWDFAAGHFNFLVPDHEESEILNTRVNMHYTYMKRIRSFEDASFEWYVGGSAFGMMNLRWNTRLANSALNWDFIGGLAASSEWRKQWSFKEKPLWGHFRLMIPLAAYINRKPSFGLSFTGSDNYFAPIGKFTRWNSELGLSRAAGKRSANLIRLAYQYDFYILNDSDIHKVRMGDHKLVFSFLFKL